MFMSNLFLKPDSSGSQITRDGSDRRRSYFRSLVYSCFKRRRKSVRRDDDVVANTFVDVHEPRIGYIFLITLLLCVSDAFLTLNIIDNGGREVNPFMLFLMNHDIMLFFWVKFGLTSIGMLFLVSHKNFTFFRVLNGYRLLYGIAAMYVVLVNYEIIISIRYIPST